MDSKIKSVSMQHLDELIRTKERQQEKKEWRVSLMVAMILIVFLVCTLPTAIFMEIDSKAEKFPWLTIICYIISWMVGVTNPLVYVLFSQSYRNAAVTKMRDIVSRKSRIFESC